MLWTEYFIFVVWKRCKEVLGDLAPPSAVSHAIRAIFVVTIMRSSNLVFGDRFHRLFLIFILLLILLHNYVVYLCSVALDTSIQLLLILLIITSYTFVQMLLILLIVSDTSV